MAVSCLTLGLCACGGQSERTSSDAPLDAAGLEPAPGEARGDPFAKPADVSHAAGGSQSLPDPGQASASAAEDACAAGPSSLRTELVWEQANGLYGIMDEPLFAFSPTGTELITPADQYNMRGNVVYSVADGSLPPQKKARALGRDAAWSRELRGANETGSPGAISVVDLQLEQVLLSLPEVPYVARLSADGKYVVGVYCHDTPRLEKRRISDGEVTAVDLQGDTSPCNAVNYDGVNAPLSLGSSSDSAVFPAGHGNDLAIANLSGGTATAHAIYEPVSDNAAWPPIDTLLTLALSPTERSLASVDGAGTLRVWSYPGLVQSLPDIKLGVTRAFYRCYCTSRNLAPVAWSPDERLLATADEASNVVVRRACDGSVLATIIAPAATTPDERFSAGPAFMTFSPDGSGLAVFFSAPGYGGTVTYYRITS